MHPIAEVLAHDIRAMRDVGVLLRNLGLEKELNAYLDEALKAVKKSLSEI